MNWIPTNGFRWVQMSRCRNSTRRTIHCLSLMLTNCYSPNWKRCRQNPMSRYPKNFLQNCCRKTSWRNCFRSAAVRCFENCSNWMIHCSTHLAPPLIVYPIPAKFCDVFPNLFAVPSLE